MEDKRCRKCRRLGVKLFLKGEKCLSPKCPLLRRPYPPGQKGKRRTTAVSEYAKLLSEKQKLKFWYNLRENQLKRYVKEVLSKRREAEDVIKNLISKLEMRLDNVIYRLGFARSRKEARQLVSHAHFLVNGRSVNIPSFILKKGDVISLKPEKHKKVGFRDLKDTLKKVKVPSHLLIDFEKLEGKIIGEPSLEEIAPPVDVHAVFEFYSK